MDKPQIIPLFLLGLLFTGCQATSIRPSPYESAPAHESSKFKKVNLPFPADTQFAVSQGAFGCCTHNVPGLEYAWDFDVPYGTPVVAVEAGKVIQVWEPNVGGGCDRKFNETAHNIKILAKDGTVAQYVHTQSQVKIGEQVTRGHAIGVTANNGFHCNPQLHFNVFRDRDHTPETGSPQTIPIQFSGLPNHGIANEGLNARVPATQDYNLILGSKNSCFVMVQISSGKRIVDHNRSQCERRISPNSTFKIPAALMAFEKGILKDENQSIKWDGKHRSREETNQDQTALTWMDRSVVWVTQWITPQIKTSGINKFLKDFSYGNRDFSGGVTTAWLDSSLKISADEQIVFLTNFWQERLPLSKSTFEKTKKIIFIKNLGEKSELYGKTGTGCIDSGCQNHGGRMQGWFVGVLKADQEAYVFAANAIDENLQAKPAGPRIREALTQAIGEMEIVR